MRFHPAFQFAIFLVLTLTLGSCGPQEKPTTTTPTPGEPIETKPGDIQLTKSIDKVALEPGPHCYKLADKDNDAIAELLLEPNQAVTGTVQGTIHNAENAYYSSYEQKVAGILKENSLDLSITTKIENDVQKSQETWKMTAELLDTGRQVLKNVHCEEIIQAKQTATKSTKSSKPVGSTTDPVKTPPEKTVPVTPAENPNPPENTEAPPKPATNSAEPMRVQFPSGAISTTLSGSVTETKKAIYLVNGSKGQTMNVKIHSADKNALFDVDVNNGETIEQMLSDYLDFDLPVGGDYKVTVYSKSGSSDFSLDIQIK